MYPVEGATSILSLIVIIILIIIIIYIYIYITPILGVVKNTRILFSYY